MRALKIPRLPITKAVIDYSALALVAVVSWLEHKQDEEQALPVAVGDKLAADTEVALPDSHDEQAQPKGAWGQAQELHSVVPELGAHGSAG